MKKILVKYYAGRNFGDDLFVKLLADAFPSCRIDLVSNPTNTFKRVCSNVRIHPFSLLSFAVGKLQSLLGWNHPFSQKLEKFIQPHYDKVIERSDAFVYVGGSIFMQRGSPDDEIDIQTKERPVFHYVSKPQPNNKKFVIGANLGPCFTQDYPSCMKALLSGYAHVCLRDNASYNLVRELPHVQYAPDVIFLTPQPEVASQEEYVVISVIDIAKHTDNQVVVEAYYSLMRDVVLKLIEENVAVTLVSFCKKEGDEDAIQKLRSMLPENANIHTCFYQGDIEEILALFSKASFVIASRFHSMILGVSFGKPIFPISYNCKTQNYLDDLCFEGKSAKLQQLTRVTCDDVLYNYKNQIITECSLHKQYASNQFRALHDFLDEH